jgi:hypothetical protein
MIDDAHIRFDVDILTVTVVRKTLAQAIRSVFARHSHPGRRRH